MVFSSPIFLFLFLPVSLVIYFFMRQRYKNIFLLLISLLFYAWGEPKYVLLMIVSILINYVLGLLIDRLNGSRKNQKITLSVAVLLNLSILVVFKYLNFIVDNLNIILSKFGFEHIIIDSVDLPIGISFFTFQIISYLVDTYRKENEAQKNIIDLALYVALFPPLIAGPILRYKNISEQIKKRITSLEDFEYGIKRFIIGLAKKVIVANSLGIIADQAFSTSSGDLTTSVAWIGIICYTLQIYYDFSGYSDMAIGVGRMFGFRFLENFNYPYISKSIKEFWRRWHISLSTWFRDYVYIPLGGNRVSKFKQYRNLIIVFLCTGIWHGASWNFLIWGLYHGAFLLLERTKFSKVLTSIWSPIQSFYVLFVVMMGWVFFKAETLPIALNYFKKLFFMGDSELGVIEALAYINFEVILIFIIAIVGATNYPKKIYNNLQSKMGSRTSLTLAFQCTLKLLLIIIFTISIIYLASSTYNPFIYFKF